MSFPFLSSHLFQLDLTCQVLYKSVSCLGRDWNTDGWHVFICYLGIDDEEQGYAFELRGPEALSHLV